MRFKIIPAELPLAITVLLFAALVFKPEDDGPDSGFRLCHMTHKILVPLSGIKLTLLAGEARSPNHWTAGEFPEGDVLNQIGLVKNRSGVLWTH